MEYGPMNVLGPAIREVPSVKYALGVAGIAAAGALITRFLGYDKASIIILGATFVAMILLYAFSSMVASNIQATTIPGIILLYSVIFFFCIFLTFTITAFAFAWPRPRASFIGATSSLLHDETESLSGNWRGVSNNTAVTVSLQEGAVQADSCRSLSGTMTDNSGGSFATNLKGSFCPEKGSVNFTRELNGVVCQHYDGGFSNARIDGTLTVAADCGGHQGTYPFWFTK